MLGVGVVLAAIGLLLAGFRPSPRASLAGAAFVALGVWSLVSVAWGGLPDVAWTHFDQAVIGGAALLLGSLLAGTGCTSWVVAGVTAGITLEAFELLYRLQAGTAPEDWFAGRKIQGPVGYANAQGALLAVGVPLTLWLMTRRRLAVRACAGAACGLLCGAVLVTQSRGALLALAIAVVVQVALARDARLLALALAAGGVTAALWFPLRNVDSSLVDAVRGVETHALRHYTAWVVVGSLVMCVLAALPPGSPRVRRTLLAATAAAVGVGLLAVGVLHPGALGSLRKQLDSVSTVRDPKFLPGGDTRLTSISLTGRRELWSVAASAFESHPALGTGAGTFARLWDKKRKEDNLSVLQPHSIELEELGELGVPGGLLLAAFLVLAFVAVARPRSPPVPFLRGAVCGALVVFVLQASVDWTLSFPALVVAVFLLVGTASGSSSRSATSVPATIGLSLAAIVLVAAFAGPGLSAHTAADAQAALSHSESRAWDLAARARQYDRWNADVAALQGRIAEANGEFLRAAAFYGKAADLAQRQPTFQQDRARALLRAGLAAESHAACRKAWAESPLEPRLRDGLCASVDH